jgi:hypothetical protein
MVTRMGFAWEGGRGRPHVKMNVDLSMLFPSPFSETTTVVLANADKWLIVRSGVSSK